MKIRCKKKNITEHFKSKEQKSFILFNTVTTLLILKIFPTPSNNVTSSYYSDCWLSAKKIKNQINSNLIAVNWNYQKSKTAWNSSWKKTELWLLYQHINKKASKECHTVARVCNHMNLNKRPSKINTFINPRRLPVRVRLLAMCRGEPPTINARPMPKRRRSGWKWYWGVKEMPSPFPGSPVIREYSW